MDIFAVATLLLVLAALFSYANYRWIGLPPTIGIMLISLAASLAVIAMGTFAAGFRSHAQHFISGLDFNVILMHGFLGLLLFAGALHVDLRDLRGAWKVVAVLAGPGTLVSTAVVGFGIWAAAPLLGVTAPLATSLLLGAIIAPTDPVAVLSVFNALKAPKALATQMAGESLFNDGVAVVIFLALLKFASGAGASGGEVAMLLLTELGGGVALGLACGWVAVLMLKRVDDHQVEVLITLALAAGVYTGAEALHFSAPIAVVVAGLIVGTPGRNRAMSERTRERLDSFWELIDSILNALLFMLVGLQMLVMPFHWTFVAAGIAAAALTLAARTGVVMATFSLIGRNRFARGARAVLIWGGLRGGISVALALSVAPGPHRALVVGAVYTVVVFSVMVQGLTIGRVMKRLEIAPAA